MQRHETVRPMTEGQKTDIQTTLLQAVPPLTFADAENVLGHKSEFTADILAVYAKYSMQWTTNQTLVEWQKFYRDHFKLELNFATLVIPERRPGFTRLLVIAKGVTPEQVFQKCKELFPAWKYTNDSLDTAVPTNDRDPNRDGTYAIWVRDRVEADEEHKNKSANDLANVPIGGETLLERLLHELKYFLETGKHLDLINITLCTGSRRSDGDVPSVYWLSDGLSVDWCGPDDSRGLLRAREVVAAPKATA